MTRPQPINEESSAVQTHLTIMQNVIMRMGENSRSCKAWCVTLVAAILVLVARTGDANHALIALAPAILFLVLDAYYLSLERRFRMSYDYFVAKLHRGQLSISDLYYTDVSGSKVREFFWAVLLSFSVLPFYAGVALTIILAWTLVF